jgi:EAL domain-containing protein (putative c-di-GMP-specific phosphodiesterase class I)
MVLSDSVHEILEPVFQPIADRRGDFYLHEALLRLKGHGSMSPARYLRVWEKSGFVRVVDLAMISAVTEALRTAEWRPRIALNVSMVTVERARSEYVAALARLAEVARRVVVEVTGSAPMQNPMAMGAFAEEVREQGYGLALDGCAPDQDFGLRSVWTSLRPTVIKLEGTFVQACQRDNHVEALRTFVKMAHEEQIAVVAKHVSDRALVAFALDAGIDGLQGFAIGSLMQAPKPELSAVEAA